MTGRIVVGWTDSSEAGAALDWAVHHALLTSRGVVVVHEDRADSPAAENGGRSAAAEKLAAVEKAITAEFPDLDLTTVVETAEAATGLLRWTHAADLLVVGASPAGHRRLLGALTDHLASAAQSPVAVVHRSWTATLHGRRTVVVGAKSSPAGRVAMRFAAQEAVRMSTQLVAVIGADYRSPEGKAARDYLDRLMARSPTLTAEVRWEAAEHVTTALIGLSRSAQIIVLGAHHSDDPWSIRRGPVTGAVLDAALCPVITVAPLEVPAAL